VLADWYYFVEVERQIYFGFVDFYYFVGVVKPIYSGQFGLVYC